MTIRGSGVLCFPIRRRIKQNKKVDGGRRCVFFTLHCCISTYLHPAQSVSVPVPPDRRALWSQTTGQRYTHCKYSKVTWPCNANRNEHEGTKSDASQQSGGVCALLLFLTTVVVVPIHPFIIARVPDGQYKNEDKPRKITATKHMTPS